MQPNALQTLADYNPHGVHEGVYPYPEECVFVINGAWVKRSLFGQKSITATDTAMLVARRPEVAQKVYLASKPSGDRWEIQSCASLAQLRQHLPAPIKEMIMQTEALRDGVHPNSNELYALDSEGGEIDQELRKEWQSASQKDIEDWKTIHKIMRIDHLIDYKALKWT